MPLASCAPVTWNVARTVELVLERLDALEARPEELGPVLDSTAFRQSRLFVAALGHVDRLHTHAQGFALEGKHLWRSTHALRTGLRKLVADMGADGFIVEGIGLDGAAGYKQVVLAWFRLQLMDDPDFRSMFYGADCTLCKDALWQVQRKRTP